MTGGLWSLLTILGPILIAAAILWALFRNRTTTSARDEARTERATHDLYKAQDAADKAAENEVSR